MDEYSTPYVSIVPRLLPTQLSSSKKIPMMDEGYQYIDNRPSSSYVSPPMMQNNPLSTRAQLMNNEINQQDLPYSNNLNHSFKGQTNKNRLHLEALKDNSGDHLPPNSYPSYGYPPNYDYKPNSTQQNNNNYSKVLIIVFGIIIGLFALTALAISIYILIKMTNSSR